MQHKQEKRGEPLKGSSYRVPGRLTRVRRCRLSLIGGRGRWPQLAPTASWCPDLSPAT